MQDLKSLLNTKCDFYNNRAFIAGDPIAIPHSFYKKKDIEISGFLTALISWGRRDLIIQTAGRLMGLMENKPFDFVMQRDPEKLSKCAGFVYRTFNSDDLCFLFQALGDVYRNQGGLEQLAVSGFNKSGNIKGAIMEIRQGLLKTPHLKRSEKHLANPEAGSAAKRLNMFLRWMVRSDENGVDFGIWKELPQSVLMCPLDIHSGRVARKLGLLQRKQNDWSAVEELTGQLRRFDPDDPVKYDFALFGMGVSEGQPG